MTSKNSGCNAAVSTDGITRTKQKCFKLRMAIVRVEFNHDNFHRSNSMTENVLSSAQSICVVSGIP